MLKTTTKPQSERARKQYKKIVKRNKTIRQIEKEEGTEAAIQFIIDDPRF